MKTKFAKLIPTTIFAFDEKLLGYIIDWSKHLKAKGFGSQDPLFPRAKADQGTDKLSFESSTEVELAYWHGAGRVRVISVGVRSKLAFPITHHIRSGISLSTWLSRHARTAKRSKP